MQQCGLCSMLSGFLRRAMCVGSRRGSSESYYRELGDQDTLKIEDKCSNTSEDSDEIRSGSSKENEHSFNFGSDLEGLEDKHVCTGRFLTIHKRRKKRLLTRSLLRDAALLDDLHLGQIQCILDQSIQWKFNAFTLENVSGGRCLPVLCIHLFHFYGLLSHFQLDVIRAWKLFSMIEEGYHSCNPYHNSVHAADVTQAMHCFLQQKRIRDYLEPIEVLASLLAAIAHDVDHPGVNQPFLIATSNHLAALYRNTSVLENHHWRSAISCLIESGLVDTMKGTRGKLERQISSLILATDITRQQEYLSQFKSHLDNNTLDMTKAEHRLLVLQIALKCADISNPCRTWEISRKWSLRVCEEFFRQGDYERRLNLPVTALCDRHTTSIPKIQTGFFKYVVTPLISEWHRFMQNDLSSQMMQNLLYNQNKWETLMAEEIAEETGTEISDADMVDDDLITDSGTNVSDSSELLLPLRRSSLNPTKQSGIKDQLRRFSVPLNVFQDSKYKSSDKSRTPSVAGSEHSLHSQLSIREQCAAAAPPERLLGSDKLLPNVSIASLASARHATRLGSVMKEGWRLQRQQTFPPLEMSMRAYGDENPLHPSRRARTDSGLRVDLSEPKPSKFNVFKKSEKTGSDDPTENKKVDATERNRNAEKESTTGLQLRENLTATPLGPHLLHRRKSMPAETQDVKEKKPREVSGLQLLRRTLSGREWWSRRRGSAPSPSDHSLPPPSRHPNGSRRKPTLACHHWLAKTTFTVQERTMNLPRRSSLPVEVHLPTATKTPD